MFVQHTSDDQSNSASPEIRDFWLWFLSKEKAYHKTLSKELMEGEVIMSEILEKVRKYYPSINGLIGFSAGKELELIFSPDGVIKDFVFVHELVQNAPQIDGWKITYLKPEVPNFDIIINWKGYELSREKIWFFTETDEEYPDEIMINLVFDDYRADEEYEVIFAGLFLYLDNCIGELNMATRIDGINLVHRSEIDVDVELIPIEKLKDYINWREKEFFQRYDKESYPLIEDEQYAILEAMVEDLPYKAMINSNWKDWPYKPVYSWAVKVVLNFKGLDNGQPDKQQLKNIKEFEDKLIEALSDLNVCYVGHSTFNHTTTIYFYSNEYLLVSKKIHGVLDSAPEGVEVDFIIHRDKYWRNVEDFLSAS